MIAKLDNVKRQAQVERESRAHRTFSIFGSRGSTRGQNKRSILKIEQAKGKRLIMKKVFKLIEKDTCIKLTTEFGIAGRREATIV